MTQSEKALKLHEEWNGKITTTPKCEVKSREDLAIAYTPGVAEPCKVIAEDPEHILENFAEKSEEEQKEAIRKFAGYAAEHVSTSGNMRGSKEYRTLLVEVLTRRAWETVGGMKDEY